MKNEQNQTTNQGATMSEITINGTVYVPKQEPKQMSNVCVIRCRNAGVHAGIVEEIDAVTIKVKDSRRLWRWWSKATLSELAIDGPLQSKIAEQKYGAVLPSLTLFTSDVCEIIPCTEKAAAEIMAVAVWEAAK